MTNLGPDVFFGAVGGSEDVSLDGWTAGGQAGYLWQVGQAVLGLEGAWNTSALKDESLGPLTQAGGFSGDHWTAEIEQLYSITARVGFATGEWLPYIKGGFAGARIETGFLRPGPGNFVSLATNWHEGWTVGTGIDYRLAQSFTIGIEYGYYDLSAENASTLRTGDPGIGGGVIDNWGVDPDGLHMITTRMNFQLN
jgi:outer membrane immunogenic protein